MKGWKLKLNFKDGLPNLEKEVNRVYYNRSTMLEVISFYLKSGLLKDGKVKIEKIEIDESNKFSY